MATTLVAPLGVFEKLIGQEEYMRTSDKPVRLLSATERLESPDTPIILSLDELFARLD